MDQRWLSPEAVMFSIMKGVDFHKQAKLGVKLVPGLDAACEGRHLDVVCDKSGDRFGIVTYGGAAVFTADMINKHVKSVMGLDKVAHVEELEGDNRIVVLNLHEISEEEKAGISDWRSNPSAVYLLLQATDEIKPSLMETATSSLVNDEAFAARLEQFFEDNPNFLHGLKTQTTIERAEDGRPVVEEVYTVPVIDTEKTISPGDFETNVKTAVHTVYEAFFSTADKGNDHGHHVLPAALKAMKLVTDGKSAGDHTLRYDDMRKMISRVRDFKLDEASEKGAIFFIKKAFASSVSIDHELLENAGLEGALRNLMEHPLRFLIRAVRPVIDLSVHEISVKGGQEEGRSHP